MRKKWFYVILILALTLSIGGGLYQKTFVKKDVTSLENNEISEETNDGEIIQIPLESINGITASEAEALCYSILGEKDKETGFIFSFGTTSAVEKDKKQYYVVRASWLVNNSHMSYIGDFFVSADGKEVYNGVALQDEYQMEDRIWSEKD